MQARVLGMLGLSLAMTGCGGGSGGSDGGVGGGTSSNASPGGIWRGTDSATGLNVVGLVDESGDLRFIRSDRTQFVTVAKVLGDSLSGDLDVFSQQGTTTADGSTHAAGTISGLVIERQSLELSLDFKTDNGTETRSNITLYYDPIYETHLSLTANAGMYVAASSGTVFTVEASGHFTAREAVLGCLIDGNVSLIDSDHDVYDISYTYSSCNAEAAALDGVTASGMGTINAAGTAEQVEVAVSFTVGGHKVGFVEELNRT